VKVGKLGERRATAPSPPHHSPGTKGISFLYLANVIGAMLGTLLTAILLIELVGLGNSLRIAAAVNFVIGAISVLLGAAHTVDRWSPGVTMEPSAKPGVRRTFAVAVLFTTGFLSMAMEVVWTRAFTPVLRTTIYSFASLLAVYLLATWSGSFLYRRRLVRGTVMSTERLLAYLSIVVFLPVLFNDPRLSLPFWIHTGIVLSSIYPFCALLGYLTPKLIDDYAVGVPRAAGRAYAWNILGCILGPLLAAYLLLPYLGVKQALVLLALPLIGFAVAGLRRAWSSPLPAVAVIVLLVALVSGSLLLVTSYEEPRFLGRAEIRRDHVATVIARGEGRRKELYVNGIAMTYMTPITKIMAHLPLLALPREPKSACVICLGMGATLRSLLSWDIEATAVELTPSVRDSFGFFFSDASQLVARSNCRIVVDDGRRFLRRTGRTFDVITIDPPPPAEASGVSLLYSTEFLQLVKSRLATNGVFQHWFMGGEKLTLQAVARSLADSFRYVRVFHSIEDWGFHFLASDSPIVLPTPEEAAARLSPNATRDLVEWTPEWDVRRLMSEVLSREIPLKDVLGRDPSVVITDDRPYNEYFLLRRSVNKLTGRHESAH